ncbi:hypothetical protein GCM10011507_04650 [Edaphobacter acidisoli]|uniref:Uncharacterized protein n=1 Tax=Edaphobacter acidisoli TaxID=2040573 RepID=A0A916RGN7_9BACT|nr:flagellar biosynthetic protein FliO [Edaphobacter acidisoli]GGA56409.1 hypothetical protein GCM10011507_04650 [Edaphobacter acidisoli]
MELIRGAKATRKTSQPEVQGLAGWAINLMKNRGSLREGSERQMRLEETLSLGGKRQLLLISCAGEKFLVGGSMESVEVIVPVRSHGSTEAAKGTDTQCS